jgi:hypothetical protein
VADPRRSCEHVELVIRCRPGFPLVRPKSCQVGAFRWMTGRRAARCTEMGSWSLGCRAGARSRAAARVVEAREPLGLEPVETGRRPWQLRRVPSGIRYPVTAGRGCSPSAIRAGSGDPTSSSPKLGGGLLGRWSRSFGHGARDLGVRIGPKPGSSAGSKACSGTSQAGAPKCVGSFGPGTVAFGHVIGSAAIATKPMSALEPGAWGASPRSSSNLTNCPGAGALGVDLGRGAGAPLPGPALRASASGRVPWGSGPASVPEHVGEDVALGRVPWGSTWAGEPERPCLGQPFGRVPWGSGLASAPERIGEIVASGRVP